MVSCACATDETLAGANVSPPAHRRRSCVAVAESKRPWYPAGRKEHDHGYRKWRRRTRQGREKQERHEGAQEGRPQARRWRQESLGVAPELWADGAKPPPHFGVDPRDERVRAVATGVASDDHQVYAHVCW